MLRVRGFEICPNFFSVVMKTESAVAEWNSVFWTPLAGLTRRIGLRYGFAPVALSNSDVALVGGAVHYDNGGSTKGNPVLFSQIHIVSDIYAGALVPFQCTLMDIENPAALPCSRLYHSATNLGPETVVVIGGQSWGADRQKLCDIWCLKLKPVSGTPEENETKYSGEWIELAPSIGRNSSFPPPRSHHAVCPVPDSSSIIVSGGCGFEESVLGDMWVAYITERNFSWKRVNSPIGRVPGPRRSHALSPLVSDIELLLHGGIDAAGNILSDLWIAQFTNDEKTRCIWTELVASPSPRKGHILAPHPQETRSLIVFGGTGTSGMKYDIHSGIWTSSEHSVDSNRTFFTAVPIDVNFIADGSDDPFSIPSVLLIGDTVLSGASSSESAWTASMFVTDLREKSEEPKPISAPVDPPSFVIDPEAGIKRQAAFRELIGHAPFLPYKSTGTGAVVPTGMDTTRAPVVSPQSPLFSIEYFLSGLFDQGQSVDSWETESERSGTHVLVRGPQSMITSLEQLDQFVNSPATFQAVSEIANSAVIVLNTVEGDILVGFVSESLLRHSGSPTSIFPVFSLKSTNYAHVQATLRLMTVYTPFRTPGAIEDLFDLFSKGQSGVLLIDTDMSVLSDVKEADWWMTCFDSLSTPSVEHLCLVRLHTDCGYVINGRRVSEGSVYAVMKSKLLSHPIEAALPAVGEVLIGKFKGESNFGILVYANGVFIRHLGGRFGKSNTHEDELEEATYRVSGLVDVGARLTPADGAFSDFEEAVTNSSEWTSIVDKIQELCLLYAEKGRLD
jgi:hypothetical protein